MLQRVESEPIRTNAELYEECEQLRERVKTLSAEVEDLQRQNKEWQKTFEFEAKELVETKKDLKATLQSYSELSAQHENIVTKVKSLMQKGAKA